MMRCRAPGTRRRNSARAVSVGESARSRIVPHRAKRGATAVLFALLAIACSKRDVPTAVLSPEQPNAISLAPNVMPTPIFVVSPRWPQPGDTVTVDGRYSVDGDGQVVSYAWNFGNGSAQVSGAQAKTVFRTAGTYTVSLVATDDSSATSNASLSLVVSSAGAPPNSVSASQSSFTLGTSSIVAGIGSTTGTVTVRTSGGAPIGGVPVRIGSDGGRAVAITQPGSVTAGSGIAIGSITSTVAQTATLRTIADYVLLDASPAVSVTSGTISTSLTTVRRTDSLVTTHGDSSMLEITARDAQGNVISGATVSVSLTGGTASVNNEGLTDVNGRRVVSVIPTACSGVVLTAQITVNSVVLPAQPLVVAGAPGAYGQCGADLWLDAQDATTFTLDGSNKVSAWRDKSSRARHATQASSPSQPTRVLNGIQGRPAVAFDGIETRLYSPLTGGPAARTAFVIVTHTSNGASEQTLIGATGGGGYQYRINFNRSQRLLRINIADLANSTALVPSATAVALASTYATSVGMSFRQNGADAGLTVMSGPQAFATGLTTSIGTKNNIASELLNGQLGEVLVFDRVLTPVQQISVQQAMMARWGLGTVTVDQGNNQSAGAGATLPIAPRVRITDASGNGIANATVTWQVTAGGGSTAAPTSVTDASGYATVAWTLGTALGTNTLQAWYGASGQGQSVVFTATAESCAYSVCGVSLWLDATNSASFTTESGNRVTQWRDLSGFNRHVGVASGSSSRPSLFTVSALHGRPAVTFNPAQSQYLASTAAVDARTTLIVYRPTSEGTVANRVLFAVRSSGVNSPYTGAEAFYVKANYQSLDNSLLEAYSNTAYASVALPRRNGLGSLITTELLATSIQASNTRSLRTTATLSGTALPRDGIATVCAAYWNDVLTDYCTGDIGEVLTFNRVLTATERDAVEATLMVKWGLGTLAIDAGNSQSASAGTSPAVAPRIRLTDASGAGVAGTSVTWQLTAGGGRLRGVTTPIVTTTDANGYTSLSAGDWVIDLGSNSLTAWVNTVTGSGQFVVFTASGQLPTGVLLRLDGSDASSLVTSSACSAGTAANGSEIGCWLDRSGNANHAANAPSGSRPVVMTGGMNGRTAVGFTLARDHYLAVTAAAIRNLWSATRTVFVAAQAGEPEGTPQNEFQSLTIWPGYHSGLYIITDPGVSRLLTARQVASPSGGGSAAESVISAANVNVRFVASDVMQVTSASSWTSTAWLNGVAGPTSSATDAGFAGATDLRIGIGNVPPTTAYRGRLNGMIGEIIIYGRTLTAVERQRVERYLGWKWGVTVP
jgi:large repetitive protein